MTTISNCFAAGILLLVVIAYFRNKYFISIASKYYVLCLALTAVTLLVNTWRAESIRTAIHLSPSLVKFSATLDFTLMFLTTSVLALYLIAKITEHAFSERYLRFTCIMLLSAYSIFMIALGLNLPFGYFFTVDATGALKEGKLCELSYVLLAVQISMVLYHCIKHRRALTKNMKFALIECACAIAFCLGIKTMYGGISIFVLAITLIELIFFIHFQQQRMGINSVTKLNDARSFMSDINRRIKKRQPFTVYLIKLRNFGTIKQNFGHKAGDEYLYQFAFQLDKLFYGGIAFNMYSSTFALVFPGGSDDGARLEKLTSFMDNGVDFMRKHTDLNYTIAEHTWQEDEANADSFYEKLEYAASVSKVTKQTYIKCSLELEVERLRKKYLINRLQNITAEAGFEVWFQPIYSCEKDHFTSMEVLLRLREKNGSFISPAEFIPLAEQTGQINEITWFVLTQTCRALSENRELDGIRASVNLPMVQLVDPSFEDKLNAVVDSYGISHDRISFEFTERVIIENLELAEKNMRRLVKTGYTFYLDDFGVGYSNFNCVLQLPLRTVKLDASITGSADRLKETNMVYILTDLFHDMGLHVVAEGAETLEQVELLKSYGVDGIQGYYFAKPMPLQKLIKFIKKEQ